ncbi:formylmethanofuran dehydrogenase subunit C [Lignipirellula cremea]|uniref:Formyltransferase/hydrolase complex Fhc subunit C n=1 Tax=Lignipirellula cremea TaxID=2528010 RepID=A0A518DZL0_9BACT|nr:formylmethanofuran dehydrogenase subunit C [Lignipirellula cremea]QDU97251.1 Formyltransferase/hydrolase complex Fhc subunit C [Lignipirellula cremea]
MPVTLTLKQSSLLPIEVEGVLPHTIVGRSLAEVERLPIFCGKDQLALADLFTVAGDTREPALVWRGDLANVHWLGAKMQDGLLRVEGNAGRHVGSQMKGGRIEVHGNTGDWTGAEMLAGQLHVRGDAGDQPGAAYRGSLRGMQGGLLMIEGSAGREAGRRMRRGMLAVGGAIGDMAGFQMLAGTLLFLGSGGIRHGAGMRRGTLVFCGDPPTLLGTFRPACRFQPPILPLLYRDLTRAGFPLPEKPFQSPFDLYHGDQLEGGRGEILLRA